MEILIAICSFGDDLLQRMFEDAEYLQSDAIDNSERETEGEAALGCGVRIGVGDIGSVDIGLEEGPESQSCR